MTVKLILSIKYFLYFYILQVKLESQISSNLEILTKEKSLIAAGHKELASMTDDIKKQLGNTTKSHIHGVSLKLLEYHKV